MRNCFFKINVLSLSVLLFAPHAAAQYQDSATCLLSTGTVLTDSSCVEAQGILENYLEQNPEVQTIDIGYSGSSFITSSCQDAISEANDYCLSPNLIGDALQQLNETKNVLEQTTNVTYSIAMLSTNSICVDISPLPFLKQYIGLCVARLQQLYQFN